MIRFGTFEVDLESRELRKRGLKIKLSRQAFRVLAVLLEAPGRVVTREELRRKLWDADTHVSFDNSLNIIVHTLREALGDSARNPRFIDTASGHGYRFVAPLPGRGRPAARDRGRVLAYVGVAAVMGVAVWAAFRGPRPAAENSQSIPRLTPLTSSVGTEGHPSFSPDGTRIAFHWDAAERGPFDIYVKRIGSDDTERLTDNAADDRFPAWSPDGVHIAFVRTLPGYQAAIMLVPVRGGPERLVATIAATESTLSWSPDGRWLAYSTALPDYPRRSSADSGILAVAIDTRRTVRVTTPGAFALGDHCPAISPDGRQLAFVRSRSLGAGDLYVAGVDRSLELTREPRRLTFDIASTRSPVWTPDGKAIVFVSDRGGYASLWKVAVSGPAAKPVALSEQNAYDPAISPAGDRIVFAGREKADNLWTIELHGPDHKPGPPKRLLASTRSDRQPSYSPDGSRIAFGSNRAGSSEIWLCDSDGANPRRVTSFDGLKPGTPRWSPDGAFLAFDLRVEGQGETFVINAEGGTPRRLTTHPAEDILPSWSRDGKWIYFASNRTGEFQVWRMPSKGGTAVRVTRHGGLRAIESRRGGFLYYAKSGMETPLWKVPVEGGEETFVVGSLAVWSSFSVSQHGIYFTPSPDGGKTKIKFFDFRTGESRLVATIDRKLQHGLSVSPDGRTLVFSKPELAGSDLVLMDL